MNERIRELWTKCVIKHTKDPMNWQTVADEFAELIVRECMGVARDMRNPPNLNYKPSDRFVDELRLHFGVTE
ncbi:MAG: hypothetical protein EBU08_22695 [Micrococcales bacterium]|nr:hypothetical protein [Micrococcales bacterium]